jgi:hypothetical protein
MDIVKGRSVRPGGNVLTTLSCSASGIFVICCDLTRPSITRLARTFQSTRRRRRREQYMPLVAKFLANFITCMCEFDFRKAQGVPLRHDDCRGSRDDARARSEHAIVIATGTGIKRCSQRLERQARRPSSDFPNASYKAQSRTKSASLCQLQWSQSCVSCNDHNRPVFFLVWWLIHRGGRALRRVE